MCLGVPGKVVKIEENPLGMTMGRVDFALNKVDEDEAMKVFEYLKEMEELAELEIEQPGTKDQ